MPHKNAFVDRVLTLLTPHGDIRARAMFGGYGLYLDGMIFAIIVQDRLYFKTDAETRPRFVRTGSKPFSYLRAGEKAVSMSYFEAPPRTMNSARAIMPWMELATIAARGAVKEKKKPSAKRAVKKSAGSQSAKAVAPKSKRRPAKRVVKSPRK
jgi:DNA transformation protein